MKISFCSDVHLEFGPLTVENKDNADVLVLAGDILVAVDITPRYEKFFESCSRNFKKVIYIMGNHEHYHGDFQKSVSRIKLFLEDYPNVHFLDGETVTIDDVLFFGATMWTNMNNRDPHIMREVNRSMNDFRIVDNGSTLTPFTTKDAADEFDRSFAALQKAVEGNEKVVVVSHHAPSKKSIHPRYANDDVINYGYHTDLEEFIKSNPAIKLWIHGHTHSTFDYGVGEARVVCNPRGYIGYEDRANKFELVTAEV